MWSGLYFYIKKGVIPMDHQDQMMKPEFAFCGLSSICDADICCGCNMDIRSNDDKPE